MKKSETNPKTIGGKITSDYALSFKAGFQKQLAGHPFEVLIAPDTLRTVLNSSNQLTGIRFIYGLVPETGEFNVILTPSTHTSVPFSKNSKPIVSNSGYLNHHAERYGIKDCARSMAQFIAHINRLQSSWNFREITRGAFFGKETLETLLASDGIDSIRFELGLEGQLLKPILSPLNKNGHPIDDIYFDLAHLCPPASNCGEEGVEGGECMATAAVHTLSDNEELNLYRQFRDEELIMDEQGRMLYELYYFISPLITATIEQKVNGMDLLNQLYYKDVVPFGQLVKAGRRVVAMNKLEKVFDELINEYEMELAYH